MLRSFDILTEIFGNRVKKRDGKTSTTTNIHQSFSDIALYISTLAFIASSVHNYHQQQERENCHRVIASQRWRTSPTLQGSARQKTREWLCLCCIVLLFRSHLTIPLSEYHIFLRPATTHSWQDVEVRY